MIASERSLPAHQSQSQQQRRPPSGIQGIGRSRNGTKPPVRPVKIYVIDPRKLQQRLEAYVGQKQAQAEKERAGENNSAQQNPSNLPNDGSNVLEVSLSSAVQQVPTLPTLQKTAVSAPKTTTASVTKVPVTSTQTVAQQEKPQIPFGLTLKTISAPGFGVPVTVTNGVTSVQPSISQSSLQSNGLYLSGISSVADTTTVANAGSLVDKQTKRKLTPKTKKKKTTKKRKPAQAKEKDDEDDSELAYLLKETTTRIGRVSRPVSQPHSPAFSSLSSTANSTVPSPKPVPKAKPKTVKKKNSKKKDGPQKVELLFRCESCHQVFHSKETLSSHFEEFPSHLSTPELKQENSTFQSQIQPSTKDQGGVTQHISTLPSQHFSGPEGCTYLNALAQPFQSQTNKSKIGENKFDLLTQESKIKANLHDVSLSNFASNIGSTASVATTQYVPFTSANLALTTSTTVKHFASTRDAHPNLSTNKTVSCTNVESSVSSIVPTSHEPLELFTRSSSAANVVPSSYSIPSSPPSQCQSPGVPDNNSANDYTDKEGRHSPERVCNSPVDPMLLRSRSPFPPHNIPEVSMHSVSVSNLSIPEESLCKGELFMDLGDAILENSNLSSISPFCSASAIDQLFSDSSHKHEVSNNDNDHTTEVVPNIEVDEQEENRAAPSPMTMAPPSLLETTEDANDGEIFHARNLFVRPSVTPTPPFVVLNTLCEPNGTGVRLRSALNGATDLPKTPSSTCLESDISMDCSEVGESNVVSTIQKPRSVWQFVKSQIKQCGISQACGEISEMAEKLSRIARDQFIPISEEEIDRLGNSAPIIHVDTPFFSHLLDLPFGTYIFKEDAGKKRKLATPPPMNSSELSFTCGIEDVEKFLPPNIDLISLPHLTNLDLN